MVNLHAIPNEFSLDGTLHEKVGGKTSVGPKIAVQRLWLVAIRAHS